MLQLDRKASVRSSTGLAHGHAREQKKGARAVPDRLSQRR
jgi:hypothetical protein